MRVKPRLALALTVGAAVLWPVLPLRAEEGEGLCVVVHPEVEADTLPSRSVADIFLGGKRHWANRTRINLAVLGSAPSQKSFLRAVTGRSPRQFWSHWRNIVFAGRGLMPKVFGTEEELLAYVAAQKGAVGHVADMDLAARSQVKIIHIARGGDK